MPFWAKLSIILWCFFLTNCASSLRPLLSPSLAMIGGAGGAVATGGSPMGAMLGAGAGSATGALIAMGDEKREDKAIMVEALTSGDVHGIVESKLKSAKDGGFFDEVLHEVYGVIKLTAIGLGLWFIVPMIYSHYRAKKSEKKWNKI